MTGKDQIFRLSLRDMSDRLDRGALRAREILDHYLERIERINPVLNAVIAIDDEAAEAADAADARARAGKRKSRLDGIPLAIKDNILVRGLPNVWGSRYYEGNIAAHDELPIALLREAGAVLFAKTNVPEFTLRGVTTNPVFGATGNAWNPELTPGGSSGGSVSAVAAGLAPASLGTDGGGSIRRPAGYTGLVGLKPTLARIPRADGLPRVLYDCEIVGPLARRADDARLLMSVLGRPHPADQASRGFAPIRDHSADPGRRRILFVERFGNAPVDPEIARACREAAERLASLGHEVVTGDLPFDIERVNAVWAKLGNVGLSMLAARDPVFLDKVSPPFADQARAGAAISGGEYMEVLELLNLLRRDAGLAFQERDIIMTPTAAAMPWPKEQMFPPIIDGRDAGPRGHAVFTGWVNGCGHPSIALAAPPAASGMPIGFQLVGDFGADELLLDIAAQYEARFGNPDRWPEIAGVH